MEKKTKISKTKIVLLIVTGILVLLFIRFILAGIGMGLLIWDYTNEEIMEDTDVSHYLNYMGSDADEEYRNKWGMDETIFPAEITDEMMVKDYKMVYYNPWDAQYLSYLVVDYDEKNYEAEVKRLQSYDSTEYKGYYGASGFDEQYELLAMYADDYQGFVYALTNKENQIIYVEIIFCNYFMDIDYEKYIDNSYLPIGFDATDGNAYGKRMTSEQEVHVKL